MSTGTATAETAENTVDFGAWKPTGRKTVGLDSELVELENPDGHKQTAIVFDKAWRDAPQLTTDVELVQSFMEFPMVEGISCMTRWVREQAAFQYETGSVLALIEIIRTYRDKRQPVGLRAAVELLKRVGAMLQEASENGPMQGIYSHGGITPWRILLDADGGPQLIGYGLPQVDMVALREDDKLKVRDDSFKYCPPERLTSGYEDITTDLYALVLIAFELATGDSLLQGRAADLKKQVVMGEAHQLLLKEKKKIPKAVLEVWANALAFDPIGRFETPMEFVDALEQAESNSKISGDDLATVLGQVRTSTRRGKALMDVGTAGGPRRGALGLDGRETRMKSATAARPVRGRVGGRSGGTRSEAVSGDGRWGKVARSGHEDEESAEDEGTSRRSAVAGRPSRRRGAVASSQDSATTRSRRRGATDDEDTTTSRRGRLRRSAATEAEDDNTPSRRSKRSAATDDEDTTTSRRGRLRRSAATAATDDDTPSRRSRRSAATKDEDDTPSRRSRRSAATEDDDDTPSRRSRRSAAAPRDDEGVAGSSPAPSGKTVSDRQRDGRVDVDAEPGAAARDDEGEESSADDTRNPSRSRRARTATEDDESTPVRSRRSKSTADDEDDTPVRSRRARTATEDDESTPVRSRRSKASADDEDDTPVRSRRARTATEDDESTPVRSRRSKASAEDDDEPSDTADKPVRSRRSKADDNDSDDTPAKAGRPSRARRSTTANKDDDNDDPPAKAKKPTRSRRKRKKS